MFGVGKQFAALATLPFVAAAMAFPATTFAAEMPATEIPAIEMPATEVPAVEVRAMEVPSVVLAGAPLATPRLSAADEIQTAVDLAFRVDDPAVRIADAGEIDAELECMAKVVHHEAGNQSHRGQLAVAQTILNRIESGRFADTICGVANQPGQFFRTAAYHPDRDSDQWRSAVAVSREARDGDAAAVAPGALFFRAAYASATGFLRGRERVAALGDHIFYR